MPPLPPGLLGVFPAIEMNMTSQTDDFLLRRTQIWDSIYALLAKKNLFAAREARQLLRHWLEEHPEDVYSQEGGEQVAMSVEAWEAIEGETPASRTSDFYAQRAQLWDAIHLLLGQAELVTARQARQMLQEWLRLHPDDGYSREAGGIITSMEQALPVPLAGKAAEPVAA